MRKLIALLLLTIATPALAQSTPAPAPAVPKLSNFIDLVFSGTTGESAPEIDTDFSAGLTLGSKALQLEKTSLDELAAQYGGTIHTQGEGTSAVAWVCYTQHAATRADTPQTAWFAASPTGHALTMLAVENVDAGKVSGCLTAPKAFVFPSFGVPGIGTPLAALKAKFPPLHRDLQGNAYFDSAVPVKDGSGNTVYQQLSYRLSHKGVVSALALSQVTTH